jgi:hypothetical protein
MADYMQLLFTNENDPDDPGIVLNIPHSVLYGIEQARKYCGDNITIGGYFHYGGIRFGFTYVSGSGNRPGAILFIHNGYSVAADWDDNFKLLDIPEPLEVKNG